MRSTKSGAELVKVARSFCNLQTICRLQIVKL